MTEEEDPSPAFVKGYNHGYQLAKHEPELLDKLLKSQSNASPSDYSKAMEQGKYQYEQEKLVAEMKAIREDGKSRRSGESDKYNPLTKSSKIREEQFPNFN